MDLLFFYFWYLDNRNLVILILVKNFLVIVYVFVCGWIIFFCKYVKKYGIWRCECVELDNFSCYVSLINF